VEATARVDERSVDSCHVDCWTNYQKVVFQELRADWKWAFVVVVGAPDFDGRYGHGYMKNGNYDGGVERAGKVAQGGQVAGMSQRRKSV
jgi:hypothetical protein